LKTLGKGTLNVCQGQNCVPCAGLAKKNLWQDTLLTWWNTGKKTTDL
jgi:hypothetical protein